MCGRERRCAIVDTWGDSWTFSGSAMVLVILIDRYFTLCDTMQSIEWSMLGSISRSSSDRNRNDSWNVPLQHDFWSRYPGLFQHVLLFFIFAKSSSSSTFSSFSLSFLIFFFFFLKTLHHSSGICIIAGDCLSSYHGHYIHTLGSSVRSSDPDSYANGRDTSTPRRGIEDQRLLDHAVSLSSLLFLFPFYIYMYIHTYIYRSTLLILPLWPPSWSCGQLHSPLALLFFLYIFLLSLRFILSSFFFQAFSVPRVNLKVLSWAQRIHVFCGCNFPQNSSNSIYVYA